MTHDLKPILLIDDKKEGQNRGELFFMETISKDKKKFVDFHLNTNNLIKKLDEWSVELLFDPNKYIAVFLHHSYHDPLLNPSQFSDMVDKLKNLELIIFSGGTEINIEAKKIPRDTLYNYLESTIDAYLKMGMGIFPTSYLFGGKMNRFYPLIDEMSQILENEGKHALLIHKNFEIYASLCGWNLSLVQNNYEERFTDEQISERISEWRKNNNQ